MHYSTTTIDKGSEFKLARDPYMHLTIDQDSVLVFRDESAAIDLADTIYQMVSQHQAYELNELDRQQEADMLKTEAAEHNAQKTYEDRTSPFEAVGYWQGEL